MRLKVLILASFTILAFLAVLALAIDWENAQGRSVEELLSTEEGYAALEPGPAVTPWQEREILRNTSKDTDIFEPIPGTLTSGALNAKESRSLAENASQAGEETGKSQASEAPAAESVPIVGGTWSLQLLGENPSDVRVTLFQSKNAIFGTGSVSQGSTSLEAAASGSVRGDQMILDIVTMKNIALYRATLSLTGDSASGSYQAFSASGDTWTGDVEGLRTATGS
jgi:hypothetical protein